MKPVIVWFRQDLRTDDNLALAAAAQRGGPVIPLFLWTPDEENGWPPGAASRWWLHQSLRSLREDLGELGSRLVLRRGKTHQELDRLIDQSGADAIYWNRRYEPAVSRRDDHLAAVLSESGIDVKSFQGNVLFDPPKCRTQQGKPYQVFTPFWKKCLSLEEPRKPVRRPRRLEPPTAWPSSDSLESLKLEPRIDWANGLRAAWTPGATGAKRQLDRLLKLVLPDYEQGRDRPDVVGTSRLSPHLHFGEISPCSIWHAVKERTSSDRGTKQGRSANVFLQELGWREFAHHVLVHFPHTADKPLRREFEEFPWVSDRKRLVAWRTGQTGYPIVDAGMRELWATGWMHNRVRMIVGSFLTKDLRISWLEGAKWFWDTLADADLANNTLNWQWIAGCGADAAPYFRIFNPVAQGEKFDPHGAYVRHWVPELDKLSPQWIHQPWSAPDDALQTAGVVLGETYPERVVDHAVARKDALAAFARIKNR